MFDEARQDEMMEVLWVLIEKYFGENAVACMLVNDGKKNMAFTNAEAMDILRMMQDTINKAPFMKDVAASLPEDSMLHKQGDN